MTMSGMKRKPSMGGAMMADEMHGIWPIRRNVVTVTVSGRVGTGKSAIVGVIEDALKSAGVAVQANQAHDTERNMRNGDWSKDIAMYEPLATVIEKIDAPPPSKSWWRRLWR